MIQSSYNTLTSKSTRMSPKDYQQSDPWARGPERDRYLSYPPSCGPYDPRFKAPEVCDAEVTDHHEVLSRGMKAPVSPLILPIPLIMNRSVRHLEGNYPSVENTDLFSDPQKLQLISIPQSILRRRPFYQHPHTGRTPVSSKGTSKS